MSNTISIENKIKNIALKVQIFPDESQKILLGKAFGCSRFVYNYYLKSKNTFYENIIKPLREEFGYFDLLKKVNSLKEENKKLKKKKESFQKDKKRFKVQIKDLQQKIKSNSQKIKDLNIEIEGIKNFTSKEYANYKETSLKDLKEQNHWLKEVSSQGICNSIRNLNTAFKNFYEGRAELPKFHKKRVHNSFSDFMMSQNCLNWNSHELRIPKIGIVKFKHKVPSWYKNRIKVCSLTVSKNPNNKYYASLLFEVKLAYEKKLKSSEINESQVIGLDFDCDDMYIDSEGNSAKLDFGFTKFKQLNRKKLSKLQRRKERKVKGSKNREKARIKLASFEEHIANCRKDWIEKESLRLVKKYKLIGLEDLYIKGMMKGSKNAKNYEDIAWTTFVNKLIWKGEKFGCNVVKINRFYSSSQICSCCGAKNPTVQKKHLETWICPNCGVKHQRDVNAARNIAAEAYRVLREAEESEKKSLLESKDFDLDGKIATHSVSSNSIKDLVNLALSEKKELGNARNNRVSKIKKLEAECL